METTVIRKLYEAFLDRLSGRSATINYDKEYDILYVSGEQTWSPEIGKKPRSFAVADTIQIDVLHSTHQVFGVEVRDFDNELHAHGNCELVAWWTDVRNKGIKTVEGKRLADAMRHATFV
jgi:hypothetical protein